MSEYVIVTTKQKAYGNCLFWGEERSGYTADLDSAGRYSVEDAIDICSNGDSFMVSLELAKKWATAVVNFHDVRGAITRGGKA